MIIVLNKYYNLFLFAEELFDFVSIYEIRVSFDVLLPVCRSVPLHECERAGIEHKVPEVGQQPFRVCVRVIERFKDIRSPFFDHLVKAPPILAFCPQGITPAR